MRGSPRPAAAPSQFEAAAVLAPEFERAVSLAANVAQRHAVVVADDAPVTLAWAGSVCATVVVGLSGSVLRHRVVG
jgi:hypothetical protein